MDSDQGKLFIGGISWETTEEKLKDYFQGYGEVVETVIMKDRTTGRARGFGFVVFADPNVADRVLLDKHTIDGRMVEAKKAVPRDEQHNLVKTNGSVIGPAGHTTKTKKIFVGGLGSNVTEDDFRKYFEQFGNITDVVVMYDHATQRPRGFGFITFDSEEAVENVLQKTFHEVKEKLVEVKRAVPKELSAGPARSPGGGFSGAPRPAYGAYGPGYAASPAGAYGANRYSPTPGMRGGYPSYGAAGYGAAGYGASGGYGAVGTGYGASAGYGYGAGYGAGAYGGTMQSSQQGAPGAAGGYGAPGYGAAGGGSPGYGAGGRSAWGAGPGYGAGSGPGYGAGSAGYGGNGGYGNAGWGSGSAGGGQGTASSPGYNSYGYAAGSDGGGYGSGAGAYGGRGGGYGNSGGYGASGGGSGGAGNYASSTYADGYGSSGYPDSTWRAGSVDGYGSAPAGMGAAAGGAYGMGNNAAAAADATGNGSAYGGYGAASRQSQRGPDARFRPYPATADHSS